MKPNQWLTIAFFQMEARPSQLDVLLARREWLFQQQQELLGRQTALAREKHELIERRTTHELQWHVFWHRLRRDASTQQSDEAEAIPPTEPLLV